MPSYVRVNRLVRPRIITTAQNSRIVKLQSVFVRNHDRMSQLLIFDLIFDREDQDLHDRWFRARVESSRSIGSIDKRASSSGIEYSDIIGCERLLWNKECGAAIAYGDGDMMTVKISQKVALSVTRVKGRDTPRKDMKLNCHSLCRSNGVAFVLFVCLEG